MDVEVNKHAFLPVARLIFQYGALYALEGLHLWGVATPCSMGVDPALGASYHLQQLLFWDSRGKHSLTQLRVHGMLLHS